MATTTKTKTQSGNRNYVEHGSERHATLLGLRKATKEDSVVYEGWTLVDINAFGTNVSSAYLQETLRQRVAELSHAPQPKQSDDPYAANYAPEMWKPDGDDDF